MVVTPDEVELPGLDWERLLDVAEQNTRLLPGDLIAAPGTAHAPVGAGARVELTLPPLGMLRNTVGQAT
jgi:hypothetical protein